MATPDGGGQYGLGGELARLAPLELVVLMLLGCAALGALAVAAVSRWVLLGRWLLVRHVLVDPAVLVLPGLPGVGLDVPRCFIAAGLVGLLLTLVVASTQAYTRRRRAAGLR